MLVARCLSISPALAQSDDRRPAVAQVLYDEARQLVQAGQYDRACPKFKESYRLDPGGGTLLNLATCYERQGKGAVAWATFKEALVIAQRDGRDDRVVFAERHRVALESQLARLTIIVSTDARAPGLSVMVDDTPLGEAAWGLAMPIDPGRHLVRAEAAGKRPFVAAIDVPETKAIQATVAIPALIDLGGDAEAPARGELAEPLQGPSDARRTIGWSAVGLGAASLGLASYFGLRAASRWNDRNEACATGCTDAARRAGDDARQAATLSTFGFAAGLAAAGAGFYLVFGFPMKGRHTSHERGRALTAGVQSFPRGAGVSIWGEY
jgi:hypothetical protein